MSESNSAEDRGAASHGCPAEAQHDREVPDVDLLRPFTIRGVTLRNRIVMSPMCQYSAVDGLASDWHLVHLGSRAVGGAGLVMAEATAVTAQGRISPGDLGIWSDDHIEPLARIARFVESQGAVPAIQLAHAGRKASCEAPWLGGASLTSPETGGWPVIAPSPIPFHDGDPVPLELDENGIKRVIADFESAAQRALTAGFKVLEIHSAHGSFENRIRLLATVATRLRTLMPAELPLFVRISGTDWVDGGWDIEQSVQLACELKRLGVDLIDVSSGGIVPKARIPVGAGYQVPLARRIRHEAGISTGAVGLITEPRQANEIITGGDADLVFIGRELLREPYWALKAQQELGQDSSWPTPYGYAVKRRAR
jgi:2,4-dienoyl-CoA reductase-like NADH-dependent reductase (Old Yellow Enzyme family)